MLSHQLGFDIKEEDISMYQGERLHIGGGGGGTSFYKTERYVPPHRVGFLRCFGLKIRLGFRGNFGSV